jgi:hypothetical protein
MALHCRLEEIVSPSETDANKQLPALKMSLNRTVKAFFRKRWRMNGYSALSSLVVALDRLKILSLRNKLGRATSSAAGQANGAGRS